MLHVITHLVTTFGYAIVAAFILLECAGFPIPGETALLVAAGFAGAGKLSIAAVILTAAVASIMGSTGGYWIGRLLGKEFVERWGKYVGLNQKKVHELADFFVRHGSLTVFFGRFVGILRTYLSLFAGISKMPYLMFSAFNALGAAVWATVFGIIGFVFGQNLDEVEDFVRLFGWGALLGLAMLGCVWYLRRWVSATSPPVKVAAQYGGIRYTLRRLLYGSSLFSLRYGAPQLSRLAVTVLFTVGFIMTVCAVAFVSVAVHTLADYDPLVRFEEIVAAAADAWLSQRQSLILLSIAKIGSAASVAIGITALLVSLIIKKRLYLFTMVFALFGGEILNAFLLFLNRGDNVFVSSHLSMRLGYMLAYDNMIVPIIVFGVLAYFGVRATRQLATATTVIIGFSLPALAIVASNFLCDIHGTIEFFEELLCAIVWLWICIGLMEFIRMRRERLAVLKEIGQAPA
ncbi:MAG TPA: DedA family protein [Chitinivibrionales bacterium]|nr:DedA family protein [Chitinivibrionales bacterium]